MILPKQSVCVLARAIRNGKEVIMLVTHKLASGAILPGGKVDPGETTAEAARRELFEETGLMCSLPSLLWVMDMPVPDILYGSHDKFWWASFYVAREFTGDVPSGGCVREGQNVWWGTWEELFAGPFGQQCRELQSRIPFANMRNV